MDVFDWCKCVNVHRCFALSCLCYLWRTTWLTVSLSQFVTMILQSQLASVSHLWTCIETVPARHDWKYSHATTLVCQPLQSATSVCVLVTWWQPCYDPDQCSGSVSYSYSVACWLSAPTAPYCTIAFSKIRCLLNMTLYIIWLHKFSTLTSALVHLHKPCRREFYTTSKTTTTTSVTRVSDTSSLP